MTSFDALEHMVHSARTAVRRFPLVFVSAAAASVAAAVLLREPQDPDVWRRLLAAAALGFPLFLRVGLAVERHGLTGTRAWLVPAVLVLIPIAFFWRSGVWTDAGTKLRFAHLFAALTLGLVATTHVGRPETLGFWHFNRILFLRCLFGAVCAADRPGPGRRATDRAPDGASGAGGRAAGAARPPARRVRQPCRRSFGLGTGPVQAFLARHGATLG